MLGETGGASPAPPESGREPRRNRDRRVSPARGGRERQRDLLPLSLDLLRGPAEGPVEGVCRATARRVLRRGHVQDLAAEVGAALNQMNSRSAPAGLSPSSPSAGQVECWQRLVGAAARFGGPPEGMDGQGALKELLAGVGYSGIPSAAVPLDVGALALPPAGFSPVSLKDIGGPFGALLVKRLTEKLLPENLIKERQEALGLGSPYLDPCLRRQPKRYGEFVQRLTDCGLAEVSLEAPACEVGSFAVKKKNLEQRLVIDARLSNAAFAESEKVQLATGAGFAALQVDLAGPI